MSWPLILLTVIAALIAVVLLTLAVLALVTARRTRDYFGTHVRAAAALGFRERQMTVRPGTTVNVVERVESPGDGIPLLLVPGQASVWQTYAKALPHLLATYRVALVDVHGHGKSSWNPSDYVATRIAEDLAAVVEAVFGEAAVIAGHSSGGLIAALMAARHRDQVRGVLFEDPPFFATEPDRVPRTFPGVDTYPAVRSFLAQDDEQDWVRWYMPRSYWKNVFGPLWSLPTRIVRRQRRAHPDRLPVVRWLPVGLNRIWESQSHPYDPRFSAAFIDNSWFEGFDQADTLAAIRCPTAFLKAPTRHDPQGTLLAALDDDDLARVETILPDNETAQVTGSHDVHFARTPDYIDALQDLADRLAVQRL